MAFDVMNHYERASFSAAGTGGADATIQSLSSKAQIYNQVEIQINSAAPTGSPTTPTLDVILQGSFDGTNWFTVIALPQATTLAAVSQRKVSRNDQDVVWGLQHRLQASVGTAAGVATYGVVVHLNYILGAAANTVA